MVLGLRNAQIGEHLKRSLQQATAATDAAE
jgi:hypothetical protein